MENVKNFDEEVLNSTIPVLLDFYADWCGPCRLAGQILDKVSKDYEGTIKFVKINVDDNPDLATKYDVAGIPTVLIFKNGEVRKTIVGVTTDKQYKIWIDEVLGSTYPV